MQVAHNPVIVSTGVPGVVQTTPVVVGPPRSVPVKETKVLGILQIVIGALCCIFGIVDIAVLAKTHYWVSNVGFGIWGGLWILIGGILGVCSAANATSQGLNGTNMAFAIVSSCISFLDIIFYSVAVAFYRNYRTCWYSGYPYYISCSSKTNSTGLGISIMLLLCVLAEFVVSIIVAVYCCKLGCGCCEDTSSRVIVQQQPVVLQAPGVTYAQPGMTYTQQSVVSYPGAPMISQQYGQPQMQMAYTTSPGYMQAAPTTVYTTVKTDQPPQGDHPPPYAPQ